MITITQEYDLKFIAEKIMYGQFLEDGYPVDRGTCIKLSSRNALLWTHGVVPSIQSNRRYYQGGRCIPAPLKITKYYGHGDLETIAKEILGFTKMNWNSFNLYTKLPATIDTSNTLAQVGNLLRQYNGVTYDYRFFMTLSKILCKWKQDSVESFFLYPDSVFKNKHKLVHNQSPI